MTVGIVTDDNIDEPPIPVWTMINMHRGGWEEGRVKIDEPLKHKLAIKAIRGDNDGMLLKKSLRITKITYLQRAMLPWTTSSLISEKRWIVQ